MAGAVDLQFSSSVTLEIFKLDFQPEDCKIPVVGESIIFEWCNRSSWGKFSPESKDISLGLIDGGPVVVGEVLSGIRGFLARPHQRWSGRWALALSKFLVYFGLRMSFIELLVWYLRNL
ncbi:hypothetical protein RHSIM_Rhsim02G0169400 [Rhododendron simsii]|uniref:Uncharacterized protein n=1 Tax=Rhododendron simsii TaxID=118357 RepID=A0A834HAU6_RHOSS|nr:hypothetical protein RHSIM_Rhsim02G0169400 [Rhododendron simsii]